MQSSMLSSFGGLHGSHACWRGFPRAPAGYAGTKDNSHVLNLPERRRTPASHTGTRRDSIQNEGRKIELGKVPHSILTVMYHGQLQRDEMSQSTFRSTGL